MELTLTQINTILRRPFVLDKGLHNKYIEQIGKLVEVRLYLLGKLPNQPEDPFSPLREIPKELLD
jgi:hypothetical protein